MIGEEVQSLCGNGRLIGHVLFASAPVLLPYFIETAMTALFHGCLEHLSFAKYKHSMAMMRLCGVYVCHLYSFTCSQMKWVSEIYVLSLVRLVRQACAKNKQTGNRQTKETLPSHQTWQQWKWICGPGSATLLLFFVVPIWAVLYEEEHCVIVNLSVPAQSKSVGVCLYRRLAVIIKKDGNVPLLMHLWAYDTHPTASLSLSSSYSLHWLICQLSACWLLLFDFKPFPPISFVGLVRPLRFTCSRRIALCSRTRSHGYLILHCPPWLRPYFADFFKRFFIFVEINSLCRRWAKILL